MLRTVLIVLGGLAAVAGAAVALLLSCITVNTPWRAPEENLTGRALRDRMQLPEGFSIDYFAESVPNARFLRFTETGDLLVSSPRQGQVLLLFSDRDGDGHSDGRVTLVGDLDRPHGIDLHEGWLYIGEGAAIRRIRFDAAARKTSGSLETVVPDLPNGGNHWTRTVRFGPDDKMYVSVGSSCNVCVEKDERRAAMLRFEADGSGYELFATGLRNSVGFDFQPGTGDLFATDNGRDLIGDDIPPCELNKVVQGGFYGWPVAYGNRVPDPDEAQGQQERIAASVPPVVEFIAHTAPLGMAFYRGTEFPEPYRSSAFVAQHGSWNRSTKSGYRIVRVEWDAAGNAVSSDFAVGFEKDEEVIGRPVDVASGPDGALYISDDFSGSIYRVSYSGRAG